MMAEETLAITGITLYSIAIILHVIAINFLLHFRTNFLCSHNQRICLLNMCFTELLLSIIGIIGKLLFVLGYRYAAEWVIIWQDGFLNVWYILIMVFLTFDRLLTVHFHLRYEVYWSTRKTKVSLITICIMSMQVNLILLLIPGNTLDDKFHIIISYVWPVLDGIFVLVALVTYIYLYIRLERNKMDQLNQLKSLRNNARRKSSACFKKVKKGFYLPTFLILSFVLTWMVPDLILTYYYSNHKPIEEYMHLAVSLVYPIALILDAVLYILVPLSETVHKMLVKGSK